MLSYRGNSTFFIVSKISCAFFVSRIWGAFLTSLLISLSYFVTDLFHIYLTAMSVALVKLLLWSVGFTADECVWRGCAKLRKTTIRTGVLIVGNLKRVPSTNETDLYLLDSDVGWCYCRYSFNYFAYLWGANVESVKLCWKRTWRSLQWCTGCFDFGNSFISWLLSQFLCSFDRPQRAVNYRIPFSNKTACRTFLNICLTAFCTAS